LAPTPADWARRYRRLDALARDPAAAPAERAQARARLAALDRELGRLPADERALTVLGLGWRVGGWAQELAAALARRYGCRLGARRGELLVYGSARAVARCARAQAILGPYLAPKAPAPYLHGLVTRLRSRLLQRWRPRAGLVHCPRRPPLWDPPPDAPAPGAGGQAPSGCDPARVWALGYAAGAAIPLDEV
jgi:hypothetical protein